MIILQYTETLYMNTRSSIGNDKERQNQWTSLSQICLYTLVKYHEYGGLHNELIRDRIVVGIRDAQLSEKMQMESELTLERAVILAR